jgi:esterase/lipase superfamily enzyme
MGNRVVLNAIDQLDNLADGERPFGHIILAAPDVDLRTFVELAPEAALRSDSLSLYFCSRDQALRVSQDIHFDSRAGQGPVYLRELINIDATRADTSWIGHAYYADEPRLLADLKQLIQLGVKRPDDPLRSLQRQVVRRQRELFVFP